MYPFWKIAIEPAIRAADARRVVEIGALRGDTTTRMLESLGPDAEFHVIDPVPDFDPSEHEKRFPGRYIFHRDISHNVLPQLPPMDVALIDGDHNWHTVYNELKLLAEVARAAGEPLPLLIMHDVCWPYGRRDLYYAPERVPTEQRQPYDQLGLRPGRAALLPKGGLNPTLAHAVTEGGPRNGVMTALDDFAAEYDRPLRRVLLPIYFGLVIVAEYEQLQRHPNLVEVLDWLEGADGRSELLELAESLRLESLVTYHDMFYGRDARLERCAKQYLRLLKGSLLDEHYLENEARLRYLADCVTNSRRPLAANLRDPMRAMPEEMDRLSNARLAGVAATGRGDATSSLPFGDMGRVRLDHLERCLDGVRRENVAGDFIECGTGRGGGAIFMRGYLEAHEIPGRTVWVADPFMDRPDPDAEPLLDVSRDVNVLREAYDRFNLLDDRVHLLEGPYNETLRDAPIEQIAIIRIGGGLAAKTGATLNRLYDRLSVGGFVLVDDYASPPCHEAVDTFRARHCIVDPIERIDGAGVFWRKRQEAARGRALVEPSSPSSRATRIARRILRKPTSMPRQPVSVPESTSRPASPVGSKDLSVIVVFDNVRPEAERALHSLSRAYQRGVEDVDYEVIVVDHHSAPDHRLGESFVNSFGQEFRYLDLGSDSTPSPSEALYRGAADAAGRNITFMMDGAHVLTPGVIHHGMAALEAYASSVVTTQPWYVGRPVNEPGTGRHGPDQSGLDSLFETIQWPLDGYRLFDIGHFAGERDWLDTLSESNCFFVPRSRLEQAGCFDDRFSSPGGRSNSPDLFERIASAPGNSLTTILGEGSFRQVCEDSEANPAEFVERLLPQDPITAVHYVGSMVPSALRSRARRLTANAFLGGDGTNESDGPSMVPAIIPDEFRWSFIDAVWHSLAWRDTTWLGTSIENTPTDLFIYQELVARVRPDWIIETGSGTGGRALFLASVCDLVGNGRVISIDPNARADRPTHPRITYVTGTTFGHETVERVRGMTGEEARALLVLGSWGNNVRSHAEFKAYAPFVPRDSYVIVEGTIVNGHPVWPSFGAGPAESVHAILARNKDFVADEDLERFGLTFNRGGFLRRTE